MGAAAADCARERTAETALAAPCRNASVDTADAVVSALFVVVAVVDPLVDCDTHTLKQTIATRKIHVRNLQLRRPLPLLCAVLLTMRCVPTNQRESQHHITRIVTF